MRAGKYISHESESKRNELAKSLYSSVDSGDIPNQFLIDMFPEAVFGGKEILVFQVCGKKKFPSSLWIPIFLIGEIPGTIKPIIRRTLAGNKIVYHSEGVEASPAGAAPTTSSFST